MKGIFLIVLFLTISIGSFAQIPNWAINLPKSNEPSMDYLVGIGEGSTYRDAYNEAVCDALRKLILRFGIDVNSNDVMDAVHNGEELTTISKDYKIPPINEACRSSVKQYGQERVYVLFQIPANAMITNPIFETFTKCDNNSRNGNKYIAWNIAGTGYPWNLVSGIEFRYGKKVGIGAYLDLGMDFTIVWSMSSYYFDRSYYERTDISFHYDGGIKFFLYKGLFIDCGYGTIHQLSSVAGDKITNGHGGHLRAGYNLVTNLEHGAGFFLGVCAGASYDVVNKVFAPSAALKIGVAWGVR